ncbi:MAG: hypothetical protein AAFV78_20010, partial [Bacteroidota bacterium]
RKIHLLSSASTISSSSSTYSSATVSSFCHCQASFSDSNVSFFSLYLFPLYLTLWHNFSSHFSIESSIML